MMQHHDAITSTSYRFVLMDYRKQLKQAFDGMSYVLADLLLPPKGANHEERCPTKDPLLLEEPPIVVGGGPYLHETVLVRGSQSARTIDVERILDPQMGEEGADLLVVNSLARYIDTMVSFLCKCYSGFLPSYPLTLLVPYSSFFA